MSEYTKTLLKAWELALLCALSLTLCAAVRAQGIGERLASSLIRLHVLAADDSVGEQTLKLRVRDAVLAYLAPRLEGAEGKAEAAERLERSLDGLREAAAAAAEGRAVTVSLTREAYPTRRYESFTLPAGEYDSLRVVIGEGKGHNWWCLVFPPLCLSVESPEELEEAVGEAGFEILCSDGTSLRFRLLELWGELVSSF